MPHSKKILRKPQVRILQALAAAGRGGLTRAQIAVNARVSLSMTANLGPIKTNDHEAVDNHYGKRCLLGLGYVQVEIMDIDNRDTPIYRITSDGVRALRAITTT